jgi:heme-degrading monooxygenase HmoA
VSPVFIAMNRFKVNEGRGPDFEKAWKERESHLDGVPGFMLFQLLRGEDGTYVSHSTWESEDAFAAWTRSEAFRQAHANRLPEGILAGHPQFSCYEVVLAQESRSAPQGAGGRTG